MRCHPRESGDPQQPSQLGPRFRGDDTYQPPEVHQRAAKAAELAGKSLNQCAEEVLGKAAG
jgi:hypothetical protein